MASFDKLFRFVQDEFGEDISIDGVATVGVFQDVGEISSGYFSDKILHTMHPVASGNVVSYQNKNWIAIKQADENKNYNSTRMREAVWNTNFVVDGLLMVYPSFYTINNIGIASGAVIDVAASKIVCCVSANSTTNKIAVGDRFIKFNNAWKVSGVDATQSGLLYIHADKDTIHAGDDLINEVPAGKLDEYILQWADIPSALYANETYQTGVLVYRNGTIDNTVPLNYSSSDNSIATISSAGLLAALSVGTVTITASMANNPAVFINHSVTVEDVIYSIEFADIPTFVKVGNTYTFQAAVKRNGEPIEWPVTYSVDNSAIATIDASSGLFTAFSDGEVNVTATMHQSGLTTTALISVTSVDIALEWVILPNELYVDNKSIFNVKVIENGVQTSTRKIVYTVDRPDVANVTYRSTTQSWVTPTAEGAITVTAAVEAYPNIKLTATLQAVPAVVSYVIRYNYNGAWGGTLLPENTSGVASIINIGSNTRVRFNIWKVINGAEVENVQDCDDFNIIFNPGSASLPSGQTGYQLQNMCIDIWPTRYTGMVNRTDVKITYTLANSNRTYSRADTIRFI